MLCFVRVLAPWVPGFRWGGDAPGSCCRGQVEVCKVWAGERGRAAPRQARRGQGWLLESLEVQVNWESTSWTRAGAGEYRGLACARRWEPLKLALAAARSALQPRAAMALRSGAAGTSPPAAAGGGGGSGGRRGRPGPGRTHPRPGAGAGAPTGPRLSWPGCAALLRSLCSAQSP